MEVGRSLARIVALICEPQPQQVLGESRCPVLASPLGPAFPPVDPVGQPAKEPVTFVSVNLTVNRGHVGLLRVVTRAGAVPDARPGDRS